MKDKEDPNKKGARKPKLKIKERRRCPCPSSSTIATNVTYSQVKKSVTFNPDDYPKYRRSTNPKFADLYQVSDITTNNDDESLSWRCDRCNETIIKITKLLKEIQSLRVESEQLRCNHCIFQFSPEICKVCMYRTENWLAKTSDVSAGTNYKDQYSKWIHSAKTVLANIVKEKMACPHLNFATKSTANDELERLIEELRTPLFATKDMKVSNFPFDDDSSETDVASIIEKTLNDLKLSQGSQEIFPRDTSYPESLVDLELARKTAAEDENILYLMKFRGIQDSESAGEGEEVETDVKGSKQEDKSRGRAGDTDKFESGKDRRNNDPNLKDMESKKKKRREEEVEGSGKKKTKNRQEEVEELRKKKNREDEVEESRKKKNREDGVEESRKKKNREDEVEESRKKKNREGEVEESRKKKNREGEVEESIKKKNREEKAEESTKMKSREKVEETKKNKNREVEESSKNKNQKEIEKVEKSKLVTKKSKLAIPIPKAIDDSPTAQLLKMFVNKKDNDTPLKLFGKSETIFSSKEDKDSKNKETQDKKPQDKESPPFNQTVESEPDEDSKSNISTDRQLYPKDVPIGQTTWIIIGNELSKIKKPDKYNIRLKPEKSLRVTPKKPEKIIDLPKPKNSPHSPRACDVSAQTQSPTTNPVMHFIYELSDPKFIKKGYTILPSTKITRVMYEFKTEPSHLSRNWFDRHRDIMYYDTGEKLAEVEETGVGRWFYKNGALALNYYKSEDAGHRTVVYSSGKNDKDGRKSPVTVLAVFDDQGYGIVYDHCGNVRLKYNQTEGQVIDCTIGPPSRWLWHNLNEPPILDKMYIEKHEKIPFLEDPQPETKIENDRRVEVEYENFVRDKNNKNTSSVKTFDILFKIFKLNDEFSLHIIRQERIELFFRSGTVSLKLHLGTIMDPTEIVDTNITDLAQTFTPIDNDWDPKTESVSHLREVVKNVRRQIRQMKSRDRPRCVDFNPVCHKDCNQPLQQM